MTEDEYLDKLFKDAGWFEGRSVAIEKDIATEHAVQKRARGVLSEYSGLHVGTVGAGRDCAASDITFLDKLNGKYIEVSWPWNSVGRLVMVALAHYDYISVFINEDGQFYFFTDIDDKLYFGGNNLREAASKLLLGLNYGQSLQAKICCYD